MSSSSAPMVTPRRVYAVSNALRFLVAPLLRVRMSLFSTSITALFFLSQHDRRHKRRRQGKKKQRKSHKMDDKCEVTRRSRRLALKTSQEAGRRRVTRASARAESAHVAASESETKRADTEEVDAEE